MKATVVGSTKQSGTMGGITAVTVGNTTYFRAKRRKLNKGAAMTYGQRRGQAQLATSAAAYHVLERLLRYTLLKESPMQRSYTLFNKYNLPHQKALLAKEQADRGWSLLDNYVVARGTGELNPIGIVEKDGIFLSDLKIGPEPLDGSTMANLFGWQIICYNEGFREGDLLTFVRCVQRPSVEGEPDAFKMQHVSMELFKPSTPVGKLTLDQVIGPGVFQCVPDGDGYRIALPGGERTMVGLVHSRLTRDRQLDNSEQRLVGSNPLLEKYLTPASIYDAIMSYGPVKPMTDPLSSPAAPGYNPQTLSEILKEKLHVKD